MFDSCTPNQLRTKMTSLVLRCVTLFDPLMLVSCGPKHVGIVSVILWHKISLGLEVCAFFASVLESVIFSAWKDKYTSQKCSHNKYTTHTKVVF